MYDEVIAIKNSKIQHGKYNDRIYLLKLNKDDLADITVLLDKLANRHGYTKVFAKIPMANKLSFLVKGYQQEAMIPNFYNGEKDAVFLSKYYSESRRTKTDSDKINTIISLAKSKSKTDSDHLFTQAPFEVRKMTTRDAESMSKLYRAVFETYPFPIHNVEYLKETMASHVYYYGVLDGDRIAALASSEFDFEAQNVEMTDFATLPEYLGNGFAVTLLKHMENALVPGDIKTAYTIARALSPGMNITFAKMGYEFGGTLVNNTNISGHIESMNIWFKKLN